MKHNFLKECNFQAVTCKLCNAKVLPRQIVNHYTKRGQRRSSLPGEDYFHGDLVEFQKEMLASVRKNGEKMTSMEQQLKRILEKQEHLDTTLSHVGREFHEQVRQQWRISDEAVNRTLETSLGDSKMNLSKILEKQDCAAAELSNVARQFHYRNEEQAKAYSEVTKTGILLEKLLQDTHNNFSAITEKVINFSSDIGRTKECVESNSNDVSRCLQCVRGSIADVSCMLARLDDGHENLENIKRDLHVLLQHSEEAMKFINMDTEAKEMKPMARVVLDVNQKMKSMEEATSSLHLVWLSEANEVSRQIHGFSEFRKEGEGKIAFRRSDVFVFCGYPVGLRVEIYKRDGVLYLSLYFTICRSWRNSLLKWLFSIPYTLILFHPTDKMNIEYSVTDFNASHKDECNVFFRPTTSFNLGWGARKFCKVKDMEGGGFITDDSFCVGVIVCQTR
ncbi:TNF receptor-associated factor 2-like [Ornithodoros turicata]|uniref:TNF receptor-associated factor 2-like n=1 Tax=Ornithodoros turicata TaxID=34597 RepID=UPI00313A4816